MTMETKNRKPNLSTDEFKQYVRKFSRSQKRFKQVQERFNELKAQFNSDAKDYFESKNITSLFVDAEEFNGEALVVSQVKKTNVEFDVDKLEKALGKTIAKSVISRQYSVIDMQGLVAYLKECAVDPKIFKSFLNVTKVVDTKELDRLEELGKITLEQIKGCYTVKQYSPYFTIRAKKGQNDERVERQ